MLELVTQNNCHTLGALGFEFSRLDDLVELGSADTGRGDCLVNPVC